MFQVEIFILSRVEQHQSGLVWHHGGVRHEQRHLPCRSRCYRARHPFVSRFELGEHHAGRCAA
jgi:hypothetical protein